MRERPVRLVAAFPEARLSQAIHFPGAAEIES
jgi:hypothetical protein